MVNVSVYIYRTPFEKVLPKLLEKALAQRSKCYVLTGSEEEAEALSVSLWTYTPLGFLPHGTLKDGFFDQQPIFITSKVGAPLQTDILFLYSTVPPVEWIKNFKRCFHFIPKVLSEATLPETLKFYDFLTLPPQIWEQEEAGTWVKGSAPRL